ncbi:type II toxin-antitoxin system Phd/YefM family antitoxin [Saccharomonospora halophila]|uniref:type II toxin-antitoxin system Phd/YefM family antitoxin n=1 Tax=Saccharomonospora halophila TaxID=129922 RepID=UPI00037C0FA1|nr:type II toxin-antitoxin system Phd/YefM family antitoxin [Saccharomonospora halophila]
MSTLTAREFNQDVSAAKRVASEGPVIITDRGRPSHVLMSFEEFARLTGREHNLVDRLAMDDDDLDFDPPSVDVGLRAAKL